VSRRCVCVEGFFKDKVNKYRKNSELARAIFCLSRLSSTTTGQTNRQLKRVVSGFLGALHGVCCMSRANDDSRAASNQSCNGRDGEKLERKQCKKV